MIVQDLWRDMHSQPLIRKMPIVMKRSMVERQARIDPLMQKWRAARQQAIAALKAQPAR